MSVHVVTRDERAIPTRTNMKTKKTNDAAAAYKDHLREISTLLPNSMNRVDTQKSPPASARSTGAMSGPQVACANSSSKWRGRSA